jgi:hypothetical protein
VGVVLPRKAGVGATDIGEQSGIGVGLSHVPEMIPKL